MKKNNILFKSFLHKLGIITLILISIFTFSFWVMECSFCAAPGLDRSRLKFKTLTSLKTVELKSALFLETRTKLWPFLAQILASSKPIPEEDPVIKVVLISFMLSLIF